MLIKDSNWPNYEMTFTITHPMVGYYNISWVGVRSVDTGNMLQLQYWVQEMYWVTVVNNVGTIIEATRQNFNQDTLYIDIKVQGTTFTANDYPPYTNKDYPTGKVYVRFVENTTVDDFKVIQLP